jgi:Sulfotransferase family
VGLRVVYIVGAQNCGSTMLDALLGAVPGAYSLGEVGGFHRYQVGRACSCLQPQQPCSPCAAALKAIDAEGTASAYRRRSMLPLKERRFFWTVIGTRERVAYARDADVIFDAVATATGSSILIDSSKNVARAAALAHDSRHDVHVIHLIRDGRGFLSSRRQRAQADGRRYVAPLALATWLGKNLLISGLLARGLSPDRYLICRYEDLIARPAAELARIGSFAGLETSGVAETAMSVGVERRHLFEPVRRTDYRRVRLDPSRLSKQRQPPRANRRYWLLGGFLSGRWGYDRDQSYLDRRRPGLDLP